MMGSFKMITCPYYKILQGKDREDDENSFEKALATPYLLHSLSRKGKILVGWQPFLNISLQLNS